MNFELRQLSVSDGEDIYRMLQEIPKEENGYVNGCHGRSYEEFTGWLQKSADASAGDGLPDWAVPQTVYWLYADGLPVGMGKLRHRLTEKLREEGGHIGYAVRPSCRGKGYGKALLRLLLEKAAAMGIGQVLVTVHNGNAPSIRTALGCGGTIERISDVRHYILLDCGRAKQ